ncbi:MAG: hypothetical protein COA79_05450 [Planctomycetota bacterium]|nr:MAG: hypothetical protein COA79_05450 [Planctomycetota bacterium]
MWYEEGLKFSCQQSGNCCRGEPGYIWVTDEDCANIAKKLEIEINDFLANCVYEVNGKKTLKEYENGDCIFYDEGCCVYEARPMQCRTWPFWESNLKDKDAWEIAAKSCPGMNQGDIFSKDKIENQKDKMPEL